MSDRTCTSCGHANEAGLRFCTTCGTSLLACPSCGAPFAAGQRFCGHCGTALEDAPAPPPPASAPAPEGERKQVTVLFADVAQSMDLAERFDADEWTQIITGLFTVAAEAVQRYGGTVDKFTGDGLMALFGAPVAQEDHATRAAHASLALAAAAERYAATVRAQHGAELAVRTQRPSPRARSLASECAVAIAAGRSDVTRWR